MGSSYNGDCSSNGSYPPNDPSYIYKMQQLSLSQNSNPRIYEVHSPMNSVPGSPTRYAHNPKIYNKFKDGNKYYSAPSPTQSLSGSSQHSGSPRTSLSYDNKNSPLYENLEYYGANARPGYYYADSRVSSPRASLAGSDNGVVYESSHRKAQPQVPRYTQALDPNEQPPVYENLHEVQRAGPQVARNHNIAPPPPYPYANTPRYYHVRGNNPQEQMNEYVCMTGGSGGSVTTATATFSTSMATSYTRGATSEIAAAPSSPIKTQIMRNPSTVSSASSNGMVKKPTEPKLTTSDVNSMSPSPTPSQASSGSGSGSTSGLGVSGNRALRGSGGRGKGLLPYSVTPPRPAGPTEAERKVEELTRQLEEEMERQEEEGEYFGKDKFIISKIIFTATNSN